MPYSPIKIPPANTDYEQDNAGALVPQVRNSVIIDLSVSLPYGELAKLYRNLEAALPGDQNRIVQFISAYTGEGASAIAFETAIIAAQMMGKRVLFIDTGTSQPGIAARFSDSVSTPLDTLLLSGRPPYEAIAQAAGTEFYFTRLRQRSATEFPTSSLGAMEKALEGLQPLFDLIVIDSQAILKDAFGIAFAKMANGSVLVVEAERTRAPVAAESKRLVEAAGGRVIGTVLNQRHFYIPKFIYRLLYSHTL